MILTIFLNLLLFNQLLIEENFVAVSLTGVWRMFVSEERHIEVLKRKKKEGKVTKERKKKRGRERG